MPNPRRCIFRIVSMLGTAHIFGSVLYAQSITEDQRFQWFFSRVAWWAVFGFILGIISTFAWLRRIRYAPELLTIDKSVRRAFIWSAVYSAIGLLLLLLFDAWLFYDFGIPPTLAEVVSQILLSWQVFSILVLSLLAFYVASVLFTRGSSTFSGRYALWPGPKTQA
jgi:hypothetical protein